MNKIPLDLNLTHYLISLHLEPKKYLARGFAS